MATKDDPAFLERDVLIRQQPILWAQTLLEEAEKCKSFEARDAILARVGAVLYSRYGMTFYMSDMRRSDTVWNEVEQREAATQSAANQK